MMVNGLLINNNNNHNNIRAIQRFGSITGQHWAEDFVGFNCKVLGPLATHTMKHLGDEDMEQFVQDEYQSKENRDYKLNLGKAIDTLRRQLPMVFMTSDLDFSIFAPQITVTDTKQNKFAMQKSLYMGAVKSLRMASSFSSIYPSMEVRKIEYLEEVSAIHCLVSVILPDAVKVDGQSVWEGSFFFGLDKSGFINAHTFDRKITNLRPNQIPLSSYPWLHANAPQWADNVFGDSRPAPKRGLVVSFSENSETA
jgi:hypothetical protein